MMESCPLIDGLRDFIRVIVSINVKQSGSRVRSKVINICKLGIRIFLLEFFHHINCCKCIFPFFPWKSDHKVVRRNKIQAFTLTVNFIYILRSNPFLIKERICSEPDSTPNRSIAPIFLNLDALHLGGV